MSHSEQSRRFSPRVWVLVFGACAISPFLFVIVQGALAHLIAPTLKALGVASPHSGSGVVVAFWGVLGSLIAAALLCFPLGWIERRRPALLGAIVGAVGSITISWIWYSGSPNGAWWIWRILELGGFIAGCVLFAAAGARGAQRVAS